jgi:glutamyl-tRNA reductase
MEDIIIHHRPSKKYNQKTQTQGSSRGDILSPFPVWRTCLRQICIIPKHSLNMHYEITQSEEGDEFLTGESALEFLIEILCGLRSPIVGETEVFGQFRKFIEQSQSEGFDLYRNGNKWLKFVIQEVKNLRAHHLIGIGVQSYGSLLRKHLKNIRSVVIYGSGHLAQEIAPWLSDKEIKIVCRNPEKNKPVFMEAIFAGKKQMITFSNLSFLSYDESRAFKSESYVVAAPLLDSELVQLIQSESPIFDQRGDDAKYSHQLTQYFNQAITLSAIFSELENQRLELEDRVKKVKNVISSKVNDFIFRSEFRPLGWDDLCA